MKFHFLTIETLQPATREEALNAFCAGHRVVSVNRHFVDQGARSYWSLCVATVDGADPARRAARRKASPIASQPAHSPRPFSERGWGRGEVPPSPPNTTTHRERSLARMLSPHLHVAPSPQPLSHKGRGALSPGRNWRRRSEISLTATRI